MDVSERKRGKRAVLVAELSADAEVKPAAPEEGIIFIAHEGRLKSFEKDEALKHDSKIEFEENEVDEFPQFENRPSHISRTDSFRRMVERASWEGKDASWLSHEWAKLC